MVNNQIWHKNSAGVIGIADTGDLFGFSLGAGDFSGNSRDHLAIGVPYEDIGSKNNVGAVNVLRGSPVGLTAVNDQIWHQDSPGIIAELSFC